MNQESVFKNHPAIELYQQKIEEMKLDCVQWMR